MSRGHAFALAASLALLVAICTAAAVGSDGEPQPAPMTPATIEQQPVIFDEDAP